MDYNIELDLYDTIIVFFSGGKDSMACLLYLLEQGVDKSKLELWHHDVDGEDERLMDWPVTKSYCQAVADAFGIPIYFSWKEGGFRGEMLRDNEKTAAMVFETPYGKIKVGGNNGSEGTRMMFPQVTADLSKRYCSAYLKIDVATCAIRNQKRFRGQRVLTVSGERAEESASRSNYNEFEPDRSDLRNGKRYQRHIDRWRPVHKWDEQKVWDAYERWSINPHPAYRLGFGRVSCMFCIFASADQWASVSEIDPDGVLEIAGYEEQFGVTIDREIDVLTKADKGTPYKMEESDKIASMSENFNEPVFVERWVLPAGAFGESCGPI